jgi:hypothetical protein
MMLSGARWETGSITSRYLYCISCNVARLQLRLLADIEHNRVSAFFSVLEFFSLNFPVIFGVKTSIMNLKYR